MIKDRTFTGEDLHLTYKLSKWTKDTPPVIWRIIIQFQISSN